MSEGLRIDKWLWYARFFKSRSLATRMCAAGKVRANSAVVRKPHHGLRIGDVLTFPQGRRIRVVRVLDYGDRRGPAPLARTLYEDIAPPTASDRAPPPRERGGGRPTKRDRRAIERLQARGS